MPRARIEAHEGKITGWRSNALPRYKRWMKKAKALAAAVYLADTVTVTVTGTRRGKRALFAIFDGAVAEDVASWAWRRVKVNWEAWCGRSLADEDIAG